MSPALFQPCSTLPQLSVPLEPPSPAGFSSHTGIALCRGPHSAVMQASSSVSLKPSLIQAQLVGLSAALPPESVATRFEQPPAIKPMTSVTSVAKSPHPYRALPSGLSWRSCPTTDTTQGGCRDSRLVCCQVSGMGCSGNTTTSVGVVKSFAWSCVETSSSGALIIGELAPSTLLTSMLSTRA